MTPSSRQGSGNVVMQKVVGPLLMRGIIPFPKNVKFPGKDGGPANVVAEGGMDDLRAILNEFKEGCEAGTLATSAHPIFGAIGTPAWSQFHVQHIKHHLKQFGA